MQKKLIALAVAGLSTAAFAQTNVTIYGVADVSAQGTTISRGTAPSNANGSLYPQGSTFSLKSNNSLLGFKGTEDLGNGNKALFQIETNVNLNGGGSNTATGNAVTAVNNASTFGSMRDSFVGFGSKYGTVLGGYLSTPFRSTTASFDVMPGATGDGLIANSVGVTRLNQGANGQATANVSGTNAGNTLGLQSAVRATAIAYALPTLYGFNGSIAYTGNGGNNNTTNAGGSTTSLGINSAMSFNLGWTGYGVNVAGAFQQAKLTEAQTNSLANSVSGYTSYLLGAAYTGLPGLKASVVYNRNTVGTNANGYNGQQSSKGSNNVIWAGVSYRFGNNEPRLSYANTSNTSGLNNYVGQDGSNQWTANWGYYLSKRTQVYGIVSTIKNNANGTTNMGFATGAGLTGGQKVTTYGMGLRTNF